MREIAHVCLCIPDYIPNAQEFVKSDCIKSCNFYEHATCVAYVYYYFDGQTGRCDPGCIHSAYESNRIQYTNPLPMKVLKDISMA